MAWIAGSATDVWEWLNAAYTSMAMSAKPRSSRCRRIICDDLIRRFLDHEPHVEHRRGVARDDERDRRGLRSEEAAPEPGDVERRTVEEGEQWLDAGRCRRSVLSTFCAPPTGRTSRQSCPAKRSRELLEEVSFLLPQRFAVRPDSPSPSTAQPRPSGSVSVASACARRNGGESTSEAAELWMVLFGPWPQALPLAVSCEDDHPLQPEPDVDGAVGALAARRRSSSR